MMSNRLHDRNATRVSLFVLVVIFISLEATLKIANIPPDTLFIKQDSLYILNTDYTKRYGISGGLPTFQQFNAIKDKQTYRIFCLGSSAVLGFPYTANASFPALLKHRLTSLQPQHTFEAINCGMTGATSRSMLILAQEITAKYQPDCVIVYYGDNELYGLDGITSEYRTSMFAFLNFYAFFRNRLSSPQIFHTPLDYFTSINSLSTPVESQIKSKALNRFRNNVEQIVKLLKDSKTNLILCIPTSDHINDPRSTSKPQVGSLASEQLLPDTKFNWLNASAAFNDVVKSIGKNENIPVVDMAQSFDKEPYTDGLFYGKTFFTLQCNLHLSKEICAVISEQNWLGQKMPWQNENPDSVYLGQCHLTTLDHETANYTVYRFFHNQSAQPSDSSDVYQRIGTERTEALAIAYLGSAQRQLSDLHLDLGWEYASKNKFDAALQEYFASMAIQPGARAYAYIGNIYSRKAQFDFRNRKNFQDAKDHYIAADRYFSDGIRQFPDNWEINFFRGINYSLRQDETDKALVCFKKALTLDPTNEKILFYLGNLYMRLKDYETAKQHFTEAIKLYPRRTEFHSNLALAYVGENNLAEAEHILNNALTIRPNHPRLLYYLNQIKARLLIENQKHNKGGDSS